MLGFPRHPVVEMFLNYRWRDVSADVRQNPAITITQGRKDEATKPVPARCTFTLDDGPAHGDGDYNPRNPTGAWFGALGRSNPVRVSLPYSDDNFERVSASGWGTSPEMGAWSSFQSAGTMSSDIWDDGSNKWGRHSITSTTAFIAHYLPSVSIKDVDVSVVSNFSSGLTVTGGDLELANLLLRGQNTSTYYMLRVTVDTSQQIWLRLMVGSSQTLYGPIPTITYPGSTANVVVRFQAQGNTFRGKVWRTDVGEPVDWQLEYSHGDVFGAGWVGIRSGIASGNTNSKPVGFIYDNFTVRIPRFAGEVAKMVPLHDVSLTPAGLHTNARTTVEAAGMLRRLSQGVNPLRSAPYRYFTQGATIQLVDYWPLDEAPEAAVLGANAVAEGAAAVFARDVSSPLNPRGTIKWRAAQGLLSIEGAPELVNGGLLTLPVRESTLINNQWTVTWLQKLSSDSGGRTWLRNSSSANDISFVWYTDGSYEVYRTTSTPLSPALLFSGAFPDAGFDDVWHTIQLSSYNGGGGAVGYLLSIDGGVVLGVGETTTFTPVTRVEFYVDLNTTEPGAWGHVAVSTNLIALGVSALAIATDSAYRGWPGEKAGDRFNRLCLEEGVSSSMTGYTTHTPPMGPQRPLPFLTLLQECVDVTQGSLGDGKASTALAMRNNRSMLNQTAALTLNYANKEVAPVFGPTDDDQGTVNDVTAKRPNGGEYRIERATGPMNTQNPGIDPDAVGRYDSSVTANVVTDDHLPDQAGWRVHMGTIDEPRYPTVTIDLATAAVSSQAGLVLDVLDVGIGDVLTVTNADAARIYDDVRLIVRGYTEVIDTAYQHKLTFNCTPASPYDALTLDGTTGHLASNSSTTNASFTSGTSTSMQVATTDTRALWTTDAAKFPFNIKVGGVVLTVTNITGTSSPQTFTITQTPVNGVVKVISAGTTVDLERPGALVIA